MTTITGFFKTYHDPEYGWMLNGYPIKIIRGTEIEINDKKINITPGIRKIFTETSNIPVKQLNDEDREIYNNTLKTLDFATYKLYKVKKNLVDINNLNIYLKIYKEKC